MVVVPVWISLSDNLSNVRSILTLAAKPAMLLAMATLIMIRHGQASFGAANYDELSLLGERQANLTGHHLRAIGLACDTVLAGDMVRQQHTASLACRAWGVEGAVQTEPAFNEYDADGLFKAYLSSVLADDEELAGRQRELFSDRKLFQRMFEAVTGKWLAGEPHDVDGFESWAVFTARVAEGMASLHRHYDRHANLAVFSSGGPISVAVAQSLGLSAPETIRLNWSIYNASVTELRSTRQGWRLIGFNNITHLRLENNPDVVTLR